MLDRDELAARCLVALMSNSARRGRPDEFASDAVTFSDALLARLAETAPAPVAPAAPAVPPAPAPVAYVPKVGDKVEFGAVFADEKSGVVVAVDEARQVASIVPFGESPSRPKWERYFCDVRMIGVATDVERLAAGLPPIAPTAPASREAVARALREAYQSSVFGGTQVSWESVPEESRNGYLAEADAALALLIPGARWPEGGAK